MSDGKYYWLKLKRDFFKRHDIRIIEVMPNGKDYILFYLKLLCESVDHEGNLRFSDSIPYNDLMLATVTNTDIDTVRSAIKVFTELGMIDLLDDGTYYMNEVNKLIGSCVDNDNANRQRRFRERHKQDKNLLECDADVMESNGDVMENNKERYASVTNNNESKRKNKSKSKSKSKSIELEKESDIYYPLDETLDKTFKDYIAMRKEMKKPMTDRAIELAMGKLEKLSGSDNDTAIAILEQSIMNSWQGLFELKEKTEKTTSIVDKWQAAADELERRRNELN